VGYFSDRFESRKYYYLIGLAALIMSTCIVAIARTYWLLLLGRALQGCSTAVVWTIGLAILADTLPTGRLGVAMGTIGSIASFGMVASPVLGGTIYHHFGYEAVFYFLGGMLLIDVVLRLLMIERDDARKWGVGLDSDTEETEQLIPRENEPAPSLVSLLLKSPRVLTAAWMAFISACIFSGPYDTTLPLHLKEIFDFNASTSGAMFAAVAVPEMLLGPLAGWLVDRVGPKIVAFFGFLTLAPGIFLMSIPAGPATPTQIISFIGVLILNGYYVEP
jgi:MFS family permease